jgi:molybdopterin-guanine dinucleotide biosynthesis protein A
MKFEGPLAGIHTGLAAARGSKVVVVGGDMPSMVPSVLALLVERVPAALADDTGVLRPLPVALQRTTALALAERLLIRGERRLRALLTELGTVAVPRSEWAAEDPEGLTLVDIDEPADLTDFKLKRQGSDLAIGALRREEPGP